MNRLACTLALFLLAAVPAASAPIAVIIGNANYTAMPPLPACAASAGLIARKFRAAGVQVTYLSDLSNGALDSAIAAFADSAAAAPNAQAVLYICGYGAALENRDFVLPVTASISNATDLLSEGILARSVLAAPLAGRKMPAYLVLDLVRDPAHVLAPADGAWARASRAPNIGLMVVTETMPPTAPTPLAAAIAAALATPPSGATPLAAIAAALPAKGGSTVAAVQDATAPPPPVLPSPVSQPPPDQAGNPAAKAPGIPLPPANVLPADDAMATADRRRIQIALAALGYYDGRMDGIFGPDSRAAIRRWQHEIGADMTGILTAAQATRLAAGHS